jgi:predicted ATPase
MGGAALDGMLARSNDGAMSTAQAATPLLGRELEIQRLGELVDRVRDRGGAILVRGDAGIGKSALLTETSRVAEARGMRILTTAGVESEAHLPFAGLHELLRPILGEADELPAPQRDALRAAFGMTDGAAPDVFLIALAALNLLGDASAHSPTLVVVEDAHLLDRASADVLAFVARRLESEPIVLLAAIRNGFHSPLADAGLSELPLDALDDAASSALLDAHAPHLAPELRKRLLEEAAGNPLALVELPLAAARQTDRGVLPPAVLPLTTRLERAFAARVPGLPTATRTLLLVSAVNDSDTLLETLDAAAVVLGEQLTVDDLTPAIAVRLVDVDEERLRFRHPLMRSAIHQSSNSAQRYAAHAALANVLPVDDDRRVWH